MGRRGGSPIKFASNLSNNPQKTATGDEKNKSIQDRWNDEGKKINGLRWLIIVSGSERKDSGGAKEEVGMGGKRITIEVDRGGTM